MCNSLHVRLLRKQISARKDIMLRKSVMFSASFRTTSFLIKTSLALNKALWGTVADHLLQWFLVNWNWPSCRHRDASPFIVDEIHCSGTVMNELQNLHFYKQKDNLCFDREGGVACRCLENLGSDKTLYPLGSHALFLCGAGSRQLSWLASRMTRKEVDYWLRKKCFGTEQLNLQFGMEDMGNRAHRNRQVNRFCISWWRTGLTVMPDLDRTNLVRQGFAFFFVAILLDYAIHRHHSMRESVDCHVHTYWVPPIPENRQNQANSQPRGWTFCVQHGGSAGLKSSLCFWYLCVLIFLDKVSSHFRICVLSYQSFTCFYCRTQQMIIK